MKIQSEIRDKDEEIILLQNNLVELEQRHTSGMTQTQHELSLKQQTIDNLEKQTEEQKQRLNLLEQTRN